ncbi:MAG TPA: bifunctional DNA-formamidopyrimidine glycosylase/DNA-(apurinic or apyrimidinic site) lyase [bacterium]|nr:bifunctional DNA-formamidopyrimidine glycosylase/DNA-(apurinic or apyrimidinic site) lyase [bacterium]
MPELPDVETVVRMLRRRIVGGRIGRIRVLDRSVVRSPVPAVFARRVQGRVIQAVHRRGKYLLIDLEGASTIVGHLRMTGDFAVVPRREPIRPHTRLVVGLDGTDLRFIDQRRFGHVDLVATHALEAFPALQRLGVEPLGPAFTQDRFRAILRGRRGSLKGLLLRQDLIAGIGNLYADEILFQARLRPARQVDSLRPVEARHLYHAMRNALRRGVAALSRRRTAVGDLFEARARGGACPRCRRPLTSATIAGRTTYFCPRCQR